MNREHWYSLLLGSWKLLWCVISVHSIGPIWISIVPHNSVAGAANTLNVCISRSLNWRSHFFSLSRHKYLDRKPTIVGKEVPADQGLLNTTALTIIASFIAVQNHISLKSKTPTTLKAICWYAKLYAPSTTILIPSCYVILFQRHGHKSNMRGATCQHLPSGTHYKKRTLAFLWYYNSSSFFVTLSVIIPCSVEDQLLMGEASDEPIRKS